ncbi:hypothetical protein NESM_000875000 [Novymonas esmeraldas]|uniref:Uncharacterized protein n=1 Tax=Novymonas esmeraldas TaxID=1808958 RepID=A0AAW0EYJ2_9TRYP
MSSAGADTRRLQWPPSLLVTVRRHLDRVEDAVAPSIPPMPSSAPTIYDFFCDTHRAAIEERMRGVGYEAAVTECCVAFLVGVLEQSCSLSFLLTRERRIITMMVRHVEKRLLSKARAPVQDARRRRVEETAESEPRYARVLTLEYLLRLYVSLPMILEHYDKLGSASMPSYATAPLWCFVSITMELLSADAQLFSPVTVYVPLR